MLFSFLLQATVFLDKVRALLKLQNGQQQN